jgi:D-serine deaminase-like pyridoxal phosphate-dependent protein
VTTARGRLDASLAALLAPARAELHAVMSHAGHVHASDDRVRFEQACCRRLRPHTVQRHPGYLLRGRAIGGRGPAKAERALCRREPRAEQKGRADVGEQTHWPSAIPPLSAAADQSTFQN